MKRNETDLLRRAESVVRLFDSVTGIHTSLLVHFGAAHEPAPFCPLCQIPEPDNRCPSACFDRMADSAAAAANLSGRLAFVCHKHLVLFAVPIYSGNEHIATAFGGPVRVLASGEDIAETLWPLSSASFAISTILGDIRGKLPLRSIEDILRLLDLFQLTLSPFQPAGRSENLPGGFFADTESALLSALSARSRIKIQRCLEKAQLKILTCDQENLLLKSALCLEFSCLLSQILSDHGAPYPRNEGLWQFLLDPEKLTCDADIEQLLLRLCKNFFSSISAELLEEEREITSEVVRRVIKYVEQNYMRDISLGSAAEFVFLSVPYLSRLFKSEYGKNFNHYLSEVRIRHAKQLLLDRTMDTAQIALRVGYESQSYFSKVFKRMTGLTPRNYVLQCETKESDE